MTKLILWPCTDARDNKRTESDGCRQKTEGRRLKTHVGNNRVSGCKCSQLSAEMEQKHNTRRGSNLNNMRTHALSGNLSIHVAILFNNSNFLFAISVSTCCLSISLSLSVSPSFSLSLSLVLSQSLPRSLSVSPSFSLSLSLVLSQSLPRSLSRVYLSSLCLSLLSLLHFLYFSLHLSLSISLTLPFSPSSLSLPLSLFISCPHLNPSEERTFFIPHFSPCFINIFDSGCNSSTFSSPLLPAPCTDHSITH